MMIELLRDYSFSPFSTTASKKLDVLIFCLQIHWLDFIQHGLIRIFSAFDKLLGRQT